MRAQTTYVLFAVSSFLAIACLSLGCPPTTGPKAAFTAEPASGNAPLIVQFTDLSLAGSSAISAWNWSFGDQQTSGLQNPIHQYQAPGAYTVTLTISTAVGSDSSAPTTIMVTGSEGEGEGEGQTEGETAWPGNANAYSWDGSWQPAENELPPIGLYDDLYFDGHNAGGNPSPLLPPGQWDYEETPLANWNAFNSHIGGFDVLQDNLGNAFGWRLNPNTPGACLLNYRVDPFEGSAGTDIFDLGIEGRITLTEALRLGGGPDMIRYRYCSAAEYWSGTDSSGFAHDNDLILAGSLPALPAGQFDISSCGFHTGPGRDLVFVSNLSRAMIDAGNGAGGRTDTLDPQDGGDLVIINGNAYDFRVFGGGGEDVIVWFAGEVHQNTPWLGPNFFGAAGWGEQVWDTETDRLVLAVPAGTPVIDDSGASPSPGTITTGISSGYSSNPVPDGPTQADPLARYYYTAGIGPLGEKTIALQYVNAAGDIRTGICGLTAIEELQIGIGPAAEVYRIDESSGHAALDPAAQPILSIPSRNTYETLFGSFAR